MSGIILAAVISVLSPDGKNSIGFDPERAVCEVRRGGEVVAECGVGLKLDGAVCQIGDASKVTRQALAGKVPTPIYKKNEIDTRSHGAFIDFGDVGLRLVARDDGVAYRFEMKRPGETVIDCEKVELKIDDSSDCNAYFGNSFGCEEKVEVPFKAGEVKIPDGMRHIYMPMMWKTKGKAVLFSESNLKDYPVINLVPEKGVFKSIFAKFPKTEKRFAEKPHEWRTHVTVDKGGRWVKATENEDYLVKTAGTRTLPWRVFVLGDSEAAFTEADIVYALAEEPKGDFSWVKPGKVQWDWWNAWDNQGDRGCNTETYKRFFDFAAEHGVEYVIFDEGWSQMLDIWSLNPAVDLEYLIDYGNKRGVGTILWMAWAQVYGEEARVAEHFSKMGVKGFKVDFMDRGDAAVERFLWKFAEECAKRKLIVDYHGVRHPTGMERTLPNVVNFEGIHGLECTKWGNDHSYFPLHDVKCAYMRNAVGPMDYTPGAMDNYLTSEDYRKVKERNRNPGSIGTRCHQMAMMAMYFAPLQMLCDAPSKCAANLECFEFMAKTPVVWADTVALAGGIEESVAIARKAKDGSWYAAALNGPEARDYALDTKFLGDGEWTAEIFRDEVGGKATAFRHEKRKIKAGEKIQLSMERGGGFAIRFDFH